MMVILMLFVTFYIGSVHQINVASVCCNLFGQKKGVVRPHSYWLYPVWCDTEASKEAYRYVVRKYCNECSSPDSMTGFSVINASEVQELQRSKPGEACSICLNLFGKEDSNENIVKTICNHFFHEKCLAEWVKRMDNCPVCRGLLGSQAPHRHKTPLSFDDLVILVAFVEPYLLRGDHPPVVIFSAYPRRQVL